MGHSRKQHSASTSHPNSSRAVDGLEAGRTVARRMQRRRRRRDRVMAGFVAIVAIAALSATAWLGYQFYTEQQTDDLLDTEQVRLDRPERTGDDLRDAITELDGQPRWNGPGNPTFGVGDADDAVVTTIP